MATGEALRAARAPLTLLHAGWMAARSGRRPGPIKNR